MEQPLTLSAEDERIIGRNVLGGIEVCGRLHRLSAAVLTAARTRLALAPWTLPHEMARLVLAEQIYRAGTIGRGEPYNK